MENQDSIERFLFEHVDIRGAIVRLDKSFATIIEQHPYPLSIQQHLGEILLVAVLLAGNIKIKGQVTVQFQSDGPIELLVAKCTYEYHIRALAQWDEGVFSEDLQQGLSNGQLVITVQSDKFRPYQSVVPIKDYGTVKALEYFFLQSEQLPTKFYLYVEGYKAIGLMLQIIPGRGNEFDTKNWQRIAKLTQSLCQEDCLQLENRQLLQHLYSEDDIRIIQQQPVLFRCTCNQMGMRSAMFTLDEKELHEILAEKQQVVVTCEYCNHEYSFDKQEVLDLLAERQAK